MANRLDVNAFCNGMFIVFLKCLFGAFVGYLVLNFSYLFFDEWLVEREDSLLWALKMH